VSTEPGAAQSRKFDGQIDSAITSNHELLRANPASTIGANEIANLLAHQKPLEKVALRQHLDLLQKNEAFKCRASAFGHRRVHVVSAQ
jgi:hypothetical protein